MECLASVIYLNLYFRAYPCFSVTVRGTDKGNPLGPEQGQNHQKGTKVVKKELKWLKWAEKGRNE